MADQAYDDRDGFIWFNGELKDWRDTKVHILTHALHYASSVFEGQRAYGGEIFKLTEHSTRLKNSAQILGFEIPYSVEEINQACKDAMKANNLVDCYVRPIAWRGSEQMGVSAQKNKINLAVAAWEWGSYFPIEERPEGHKNLDCRILSAGSKNRPGSRQGRRSIYDLHHRETSRRSRRIF